MTREPDAPLHRTPAQWGALIVGGVLVLLGLLGFLVDASFTTGEDFSVDEIAGVGVNGWANLVHLGAGLALLAAAQTRPTARTVSFVVAIAAFVVFLIGVADGDDVLGVMAINGVANVLHLTVAAVLVLCAYFSPTTAGQQRRRRESKLARREEKRRPADAGEDAPARHESHMR